MSDQPVYCPVCAKPSEGWASARDYEYFSVPGEFNYYQCGDCKTIFINPVPIHLLDKIYPANYYSFVNNGKNIVVRIKEWLDRRFFRKILKSLAGDEINVLDVGGGTGWMLDVLKSADKRIAHSQVVDIDEHAAAMALKNGHAYFKGTIEEFETDKKFHLVLMLNLVEHVADPLAILQKASDLLHPGGQIVIKTPNTKSLDAGVFRKSYWGGLHCPRHWIIFSEESFRLMLRSTPLKVQRLDYTQGAPFWTFSLIAMLHRKKWLKVSADKPIIFHWLFAPVSACFAVFDFLRKPFSRTSQMFIILGK